MSAGPPSWAGTEPTTGSMNLASVPSADVDSTSPATIAPDREDHQWDRHHRRRLVRVLGSSLLGVPKNARNTSRPMYSAERRAPSDPRM